jgi:ureidoacrylate peracid hydrolase
MITVEARPEPVSVDPERTAVLVVDMQNDFGAVGGMFHRESTSVASLRQ